MLYEIRNFLSVLFCISLANEATKRWDMMKGSQIHDYLLYYFILCNLKEKRGMEIYKYVFLLASKWFCFKSLKEFENFCFAYISNSVFFYFQWLWTFKEMKYRFSRESIYIGKSYYLYTLDNYLFVASMNRFFC